MGLLNLQANDEPSAPDRGGDAGFPDLAAVREEIRKSRGTGKSAGKRAKGRTAEEVPDDGGIGITEQDVANLFSGEKWEELPNLYPQARYAMTGWDGFLLSDDQKKVLGSTLAATMKMLLQIDPRYIAMTLFFTNYLGIIGSKELAWHNIKKERNALAAVK